jgi:hypothetical protein
MNLGHDDRAIRITIVLYAALMDSKVLSCLVNAMNPKLTSAGAAGYGCQGESIKGLRLPVLIS